MKNNNKDIKNILSVNKLTVSFGGLKALDELDIKIREGSITALIGPNGSGKTTSLNVINGIYIPNEGNVVFKNKQITGMKPHNITQLGIARTFQNIRLFQGLTILKNVMIGQHCRTSSNVFSIAFHSRSMLMEEKKIISSACKALKFVELEKYKDILAKNLSYGQQRLLEIARALATEPSLLLLDEPAAGMNASEVNSLIDLIRAIRDRGITILLIEHNMNLVMNIADYIMVLNFGRKITEGIPREIVNDKQVIEAYLGKVVVSHA